MPLDDHTLASAEEIFFFFFYFEGCATRLWDLNSPQLEETKPRIELEAWQWKHGVLITGVHVW